MEKLLIVTESLKYSQKIINLLADKENNVKIYKIITKYDELVENMKSKDKIDMILIYLNKITDEKIRLINMLEKNYDLIIVTRNDKELIKEEFFSKNKKIYEEDEYANVIKSIEKVARKKEKDRGHIKEKVMKELGNLQYSSKLKGTQYLCDSIVLLLENEELYMKNLKNYVYPSIAQKYNTSIHNVKCNVNNATIDMNCYCPKKIIAKYFYVYDEKIKITPKQVVEEVFKKIKFEQK